MPSILIIWRSPVGGHGVSVVVDDFSKFPILTRLPSCGKGIPGWGKGGGGIDP